MRQREFFLSNQQNIKTSSWNKTKQVIIIIIIVFLLSKKEIIFHKKTIVSRDLCVL